MRGSGRDHNRYSYTEPICSHPHAGVAALPVAIALFAICAYLPAPRQRRRHFRLIPTRNLVGLYLTRTGTWRSRTVACSMKTQQQATATPGTEGRSTTSTVERSREHLFVMRRHLAFRSTPLIPGIALVVSRPRVSTHRLDACTAAEHSALRELSFLVLTQAASTSLSITLTPADAWRIN